MAQLVTYRDLIVWQRSMQLVVEVYKLTEAFPKAELYGLTSQIRRCCVSIPSNIAEGRRWSTRKDFRKFLTIAYGSGAELETQIEIAKRLGYTAEQDCIELDRLLAETMKMLNKMLLTLSN
ncbi:MAG: four helix bundle protein [Patescibacteria group bacterium]|jgi:four helix bundle protein